MGKKDRKYDEEGFVIRTNKEEEKRKRDEIRHFVRELLKLSNDKYIDLPIDDRLCMALAEGKRLTGNAHKRHLSFLVRLVHEQGFDKIRNSYEYVHHAYRNDPTKIRLTEDYRNRLIKGDKKVIDELLGKFTDVDIQYLRQLSRNTNSEIKAEIKKLSEQAEKKGLAFDSSKPIKDTKSSKLLYQYLFKLKLL